MVEFAATRAQAAVGSMFGDDNRHGWQFGNLMTPWLRIAGIAFSGQRRMAFRTYFGDIFDDFVDSFGWKLQTMMTAMARLPALLSPGGLTRKPFWGTKRICGWWNRGVRRVTIQALLKLKNDDF